MELEDEVLGELAFGPLPAQLPAVQSPSLCLSSQVYRMVIAAVPW